MRVASLCLLLAVTIAMGACGKQRAAAEHDPATAVPAAALTPPANGPAPTATVAQRQEVGLAPTQPSTVTRPNEDGSETVEETTGDSGTHNPILAAVASTMAAGSSTATAATTAATPTPWQEGVNYTRLVPAQPTSVAPGQVEALEFFWYGCPHCYALDPLLETWRKAKPAYIAFSRVPVMWSESHRSTARLYYTLESLGKLDQLHSEVFKEIHVNADPLTGGDPNDAAGAEHVQAAFLRKFGIPEDEFTKADHSFAVETDLQRAEQLGLRYRIESVPTFVINGKYMTDVRAAGSPERLIALLGDLAAQEHKH
jgi:thiol:disulfide interchange protein DsbA